MYHDASAGWPDTLAADRQRPMYGTMVLPKHNWQLAGVAGYDAGDASPAMRDASLQRPQHARQELLGHTNKAVSAAGNAAEPPHALHGLLRLPQTSSAPSKGCKHCSDILGGLQAWHASMQVLHDLQHECYSACSRHLACVAGLLRTFMWP